MIIEEGLDIKCVFLTDEEIELSKLEIETRLKDSSSERFVTFYTIDALYHFYEDDVEYTCIWSGATSYMIKQRVKDIKELIKQSKLK